MLEKVQIKEPITLEELRKLSGLTITEFSKEIDVPETTYRRYEREPRKMDVGKLLDICEKFEIPFDMIKV